MSAGQSDRHNQICACQNTTNRVFVPVNDRDRTLIIFQACHGGVETYTIPHTDGGQGYFCRL
jgi:hypothetical protein